jgi:4-hydroxy-3-methylbut-2-enyl diphosphate reductase IspH
MWKVIPLGGGATPVSIFREHGVPRASMCALHVYDAKCPRVGKTKEMETAF